MKTPRDILLQRHEGMASKLNAVRHRALAEVAQPPAQSWREWLRPLRWHLAGLGAVWLAVLLLHCDLAPGSATPMAKNKIPTARVLVAALLENRRELIELTEGPMPAAPPATLPPRRSENQSATVMV